MSDFGPPSFSLGLDFDLDSQLPPPVAELDPLQFQPQRANPSSSAVPDLHNAVIDDTDDELQSPRSAPLVGDPFPALKRLRRGPKFSSRSTQSREACSNLEDDIENFSSQEADNPKDDPVTQCHSVTSSSKLPLHGLGVLASQPENKWRKKKEVQTYLVSENMGSSSKIMTSPGITLSPVRRFQLIDSDSDEFSLDEVGNNKANKTIFPVKWRNSSSERNVASTEKEIKQASAAIPHQEDLWKDFSLEKSFHIPTPAFDEVCKEYFSSVRDKIQMQNKSRGCPQTSNIGKKNVQQLNLNPQAPAHHYFFHDDPRIRKLVRDRLPNFSPLCATTSQEYQHQDGSVFDYISQFGHGECSRHAVKRHQGENSTKNRKNTSRAKGKAATPESVNWINPKDSAGVPKDAGKRRVHAVGNSAGHWFMDADGRKVYVTKKGQELTGQAAYRHYRKESGAGFRKSKKKTTTKKISGTKRK